MDPRLIIRAIAVLLLAGSVFACAVDVGRLGGDPDTSDTSRSDNNDPSAAELAHCNALGAQAANDTACQAAWAKNRQHFFATGRVQQGHPSELFPSLENASPPKAPSKTKLDRALSAPLPNAALAPNTNPPGR